MTSTRPDPPDLEFETPPCSLCGEATYAEGCALSCLTCEVTWEGDGTNGEWNDPDADQCPFIVVWSLGTLPCCRTAGHTGPHIPPE